MDSVLNKACEWFHVTRCPLEAAGDCGKKISNGKRRISVAVRQTLPSARTCSAEKSSPPAKDDGDSDGPTDDIAEVGALWVEAHRDVTFDGVARTAVHVIGIVEDDAGA